jgi:hypothetical protein
MSPLLTGFPFSQPGGAVYGSGTGGTSSAITIGGVATTLMTFTASGTFTVSKAGIFDLLIVGGGAADATPVTYLLKLEAEAVQGV